jgi:ABC-type nickel/cobalt efflux system permease component RcnA
MPKALCLFSLVASILVVSLFVLDAIASIAGVEALAVLGSASLLMDLTFIVVGGILIYLSWSTYREQRR